MKLYGGMDIRSTNVVTKLIDEDGKVVYSEEQDYDLKNILERLKQYKKSIKGIAIKYTFNWYDLVNGLVKAGYRVHLVNKVAIKQNIDLKFVGYDLREKPVSDNNGKEKILKEFELESEVSPKFPLSLLPTFRLPFVKAPRQKNFVGVLTKRAKA